MSPLVLWIELMNNDNYNNNLVWWYCHRVAPYKMWYILKSASPVVSTLNQIEDEATLCWEFYKFLFPSLLCICSLLCSELHWWSHLVLGGRFIIISIFFILNWFATSSALGWKVINSKYIYEKPQTIIRMLLWPLNCLITVWKRTVDNGMNLKVILLFFLAIGFYNFFAVIVSDIVYI